MAAEGSSYIGRAYERLTELSADDKKRLEYEAREKAVRDYNQGMYEAEERGVKRGKQEESVRVAKDMLQEGFDVKIISKISGLSLPEIEKLKNTLLGEANKNSTL